MRVFQNEDCILSNYDSLILQVVDTALIDLVWLKCFKIVGQSQKCFIWPVPSPTADHVSMACMPVLRRSLVQYIPVTTFTVGSIMMARAKWLTAGLRTSGAN